MSHQSDAKAVLDEVQARLGIGLLMESATVDGGLYDVLRPTDLERGHGFFVAIARTPRQVTASVHFDPHAGRLFRLMSEADDGSKAAMTSLADSAHTAGLTAYCIIERSDEVGPSRAGGPWKSLEVEVSARLPQKLDAITVRRVTADTVSYAFAMPLCLLQVEEILPASRMSSYPEGAVTRIEVNRYERSPANRAACLAFHGTKCLGCGFDFGLTYGSIASGYIEVHHVVPVSAMGGSYMINPVTDLVPLCSNCHSVVHRVEPPLSINELRSVLASSHI